MYLQESGSADIYIHQILNHDQTPREVIGMVCKHELLHLRIPPGEEGGKVLMHASDFRIAERSICPERHRVWAWVWTNLGLCLNYQAILERIDVLPGWKKFWNQARTDIETCLGFYQLASKEPEEGIW